MVKKKRHTEHADERWLLTYADMITLLMALFMVLFSMSVVNQGKFEELSRSLRTSFAGPLADSGGRSVLSVGGNDPTLSEDRAEAHRQSPGDGPLRKGAGIGSGAAVTAERDAERQEDQLREAKRRIDAQIGSLNLQKLVSTTIDQRGLVIRLTTDDVLFDVSRAEVKPAALPLLSVVARAVNRVGRNPVVVEGHTDARPYPGDRFGNLVLSQDRATNVWRTLVSFGFEPDAHGNDVPVGYGDTRLLVPTDGVDPTNRRVEVVVKRVDVTSSDAVAAAPVAGIGRGLGAAPSITPPVEAIAPGAPVVTPAAAPTAGESAVATTAGADGH